MSENISTVSVVIPAYNSKQTVQDAINSALQQTLSDIEVIVVDDGSDDGTRQVAELVEDSRVTVISHNQNRGRSAARNTGVAASSGEFIAYLDADDVWYPTKLEKQVACLRDRSKVWLGVYCGAEYSRASKLVQVLNDMVPRPTGLEGGNELLSELLMWRWGAHPGSTLLIRSKAVEKIGDWNTAMNRWEDRGYLVQLLEAGKLAYVDEDLVQVRESGKPNAHVIKQAHESFFKQYSEQISAVESEGYDPRGAHEFFLSKFYFSSNQFTEGVRSLRGSTCPHPRDYFGLGMALVECVRSNMSRDSD